MAMPAKFITNRESLEADGTIAVYSLESGRVVAQYEGLEVHEAMQENARLRERVAALEGKIKSASYRINEAATALNYPDNEEEGSPALNEAYRHGFWDCAEMAIKQLDAALASEGGE